MAMGGEKDDGRKSAEERREVFNWKICLTILLRLGRLARPSRDPWESRCVALDDSGSEPRRTFSNASIASGVRRTATQSPRICAGPGIQKLLNQLLDLRHASRLMRHTPPNGSRLSLSPRECAGSGWFWNLRDYEAGATWPAMHSQTQYTTSSIEDAKRLPTWLSASACPRVFLARVGSNRGLGARGCGRGIKLTVK